MAGEVEAGDIEIHPPGGLCARLGDSQHGDLTGSLAGRARQRSEA
jgi:hypothetical protein